MARSSKLGDIRLRVHEHPGHTEGSSSYSMQVNENDRDYNVVIANMGTINAGKRLVVDPTYPGVAEDFARTYASQKSMELDVWVAAHGGHYGLHDKYEPGQGVRPRIRSWIRKGSLLQSSVSSAFTRSSSPRSGR